MATWFVEPLHVRPDFRLLVTFLWGEGHIVDSDGDSWNPASTEWTELYLQNRENPAETVEVNVTEDSPNCFRVDAKLPWLAAATAYFLASEGNARARSQGGDATAVEHLGSFDLQAAVMRAKESIWRTATLDDPYPNLRT